MTTEDQFTFLATIPGIILGLAVVQILNGLANILQNIRSVRTYWVHSIWMFILGLALIQHWYVLYSWRDFGSNIVSYIFFMLYPINLFIASALLVPQIGKNEEVDLKEHYYSKHKLFFGMMTLLMIESIARTTVLGRSNFFAVDTLYRLVGFSLFCALFLSKNKRLHSAAALVTTCLFTAFIVQFSFKLAH